MGFFSKIFRFARIKTDCLRKDFCSALRGYRQASESFFHKITRRKSKAFLQKLYYNRTQRYFTPKHGEWMDASDEKVRNKIWDSQERADPILGSHLMVLC